MAGEKGKKDKPLTVEDEPGMAERFQRGLRNLINTPPQPRKPAGQKAKERPEWGGASARGKRNNNICLWRTGANAKNFCPNLLGMM